FACLCTGDEGAVRVQPGSVVSFGVPEETLAVILDGLGRVSPQWVKNRLGWRPASARCFLTNEGDREIELEYPPGRDQAGISAGITLLATDLDGVGFLISFGVPPKHRLLPETRIEMGRAATHILAALRLRRRLCPKTRATLAGGPFAEPPPEPEAVLAPD